MTRVKEGYDRAELPSGSEGQSTLYPGLLTRRVSVKRPMLHGLGSREGAFIRIVGALVAARFVLECKPGLYEMQDVLGLK